MEEDISIVNTEILSDNWSKLKKVTFKIRKKNGEWESQSREVFDRGDGATVLLYNKENKTILLTRQFRLPSYLNGNEDGKLIEACAGLLEENDPESCIRKESLEETGYKISEVKKIFETYMSPGAATEKLHYFIAPYSGKMKVSEGGGAREEKENIEVLELDFEEAFNMIYTGKIKDSKTILLLQYAKIHRLL